MSQLEFNTDNPSERETLFVDLLLPVPIPKLFTYRVPHARVEEVQLGIRVIVPFGNRRVLTGVVGHVHHEAPKKYEARYLLDILDETPVVTTVQLQLFRWMADYYMCYIGEVLNIALPSGLKLSSESRVQLHPYLELDSTDIDFSDQEYNLLLALKGKEHLSYEEVSSILGIKSIYGILKVLVEKGAILIFEEVKEKYKPKKETRIRFFSEAISRPNALEDIFKQLQSRPKQIDVLLWYLQQVPVYESPRFNDKGIEQSQFKKNGLSSSALQTLIKNGILERFEVEVSRFGTLPNQEYQEIQLSPAQSKAKQQILQGFDTTSTVLLHGITGSGKTEVYIDLIKNALSSGGQVLYLLPEIALTTQIVHRLRKVFGEQMGVYHSKFSDNERVEIWQGVLSGAFSFVVGVRSSVFLPFDNLSLIIVDEEHESSYKQYDPAPRYHARDVALYLAHLHFSKVLLGSATPSLESYSNAMEGKYTLVTMEQRYGGASLPQMILADTLREKQRKLMKGDFSFVLLEALNRTLQEKKQAIIFQNRRGYSPHLTCETCSWIPKCENCAVSLTYHMYKKEMRCHYCGYRLPVPNTCEACGAATMKTVGIGTEKLEESLQLMLPSTNIQRMDLDTTRKKYAYDKIIEGFEKGEIDILVGTQMVSKGLDFDGVVLVGVIDADRMLHFPDFRSFERTFQLITQVSGRAGRREEQGKVVIQTSNPQQEVLQKIIDNDYIGFYQSEIRDREQYRYPPFTRLIRITIKHKDKRMGEISAQKLCNLLVEPLGKKRVLGPEAPGINKIRNLYLVEILIKLEKGSVPLQKVKKLIQDRSLSLLKDAPEAKAARIIFDVDPY